MANYITSDLHFGHRNVMQYCPESRGHFSDVEHMNETIINNINSVVTDNDTLYILGDIAFMSPGKACSYLKQINGEKVIVWGNHDRKLRNSTEFASQKGLMGIVSHQDYISKHFEHEGAKYGVVMMHFPIYRWEGIRFGAIHLHGHCHSIPSKRNTFGDSVRAMDIGMDGHNLMPYNIDDIIKEMTARVYTGEDYHGK